MGDQQGTTGPKRPGRNRGRRDPLERQWQELTGSGRSEVNESAALRARDADQPTAQELAQAESEVVIQRRHWHPGAARH